MEQAFRNEIIHKLMSVFKKTANKTHEKLEVIGLHRGQPVLLYLLWEKDGLSGRELSEYMEVQPATVTKMVRRLKSTGFITTKQDDKDSRVSRVYLTDQGRAIEEEVKDVFRSFEAMVFKDFSEEQIELMAGLLDQIRDNLNTGLEEEVKQNE